MRSFISLLFILLTGCFLEACGVKGSLLRPQGSTDTTAPDAQPDTSTDPAADPQAPEDYIEDLNVDSDIF